MVDRGGRDGVGRGGVHEIGKTVAAAPRMSLYGADIIMTVPVDARYGLLSYPKPRVGRDPRLRIGTMPLASSRLAAVTDGSNFGEGGVP